MKFTDIDHSASSAAGWLHHIPVSLKLIGLIAFIAIALITWNSWILLGLVIVLLLVALSSNIRLRLFVPLAAYPLIFTVLLALTLNVGWIVAGILLLKTAIAAGAAVLLVLSTPYPRIFAATGRVLPQLINDSLLMTYRSIFILGETLGNLLTSLHLRGSGSWRHPLRFLRAAGDAFGTLILFSIELAEQDYELLRLRGYDGTMRLSSGSLPLPSLDTKGLHHE